MTDTTLSPDEVALEDYLAEKRAEYEDRVAHGREKVRGKFIEWAWKAINNDHALTHLPTTMFNSSRSAIQTGFDRVILGTFNKNGTVRKPGIRPASDYRVMEHDDGEFILLDLHDEKAWDEYEAWLVMKMGVAPFRTEYTLNETTLDEFTRDLDEITRDKVAEPVTS
jgi:hypothetical protein